jgi:hypothetical protein
MLVEERVNSIRCLAERKIKLASEKQRQLAIFSPPLRFQGHPRNFKQEAYGRINRRVSRDVFFLPKPSRAE